jgi:hypothetical protein
MYVSNDILTLIFMDLCYRQGRDEEMLALFCLEFYLEKVYRAVRAYFGTGTVSLKIGKISVV